MCGIIGILGKTLVAPRLLDGLKRLEYRGYDSTGMASLVDGKIDIRRAEGKIVNLIKTLESNPLKGHDGIGHTRWATHGSPTLANAHPHCTDRLALVHNGIIENYQELRDSLKDQAITYSSETDSEVVAHLITKLLNQGLSPEAAVKETLGKLHGAFALVMIFAGVDGLMIGARRGSPLAIGYGDGEMYLGSDALALAPFSNQISYLEEGDWVILSRDNVQIFDRNNQKVTRKIIISKLSNQQIEIGNYRHFMEKEIHEQPGVVAETLHSLLDQSNLSLALPPLPFDVAPIPRITASACGTAYYACMVGKYWVEGFADLTMDTDIASELRYRNTPMQAGGVSLFVSQSGETMDSLEALRYAKAKGQTILSIVNVPESTIMRESDYALLTHAGPEIGVASTKAFTTQLMVMACFALNLAKLRGKISAEQQQVYLRSLIEIPGLMRDFLTQWEQIKSLAPILSKARAVFYMGRGNCFPIALEGALKLKEISYIHAEGYAAGEMKHGPIALIDENLPVVMLAPSGPLLEKTAANVREITARSGQVILVADQAAIDFIQPNAKLAGIITMPKVNPLFAPLLYSLPMQILAYETAILRGTDIDKPRNLAKSVTVE